MSFSWVFTNLWPAHDRTRICRYGRGAPLCAHTEDDVSEPWNDNQLSDQIMEASSRGESLFARFGGRSTLDKVHKIFYDKIYADPWLSLYFAEVNQSIIEAQQTDFFAQLSGGPKMYSGRMPLDAHMHILAGNELFNHRHKLLADSLIEAEVPERERLEWLRIDAAFRKVVVKESVSECVKRYNTDKILDFPKPEGVIVKNVA